MNRNTLGQFARKQLKHTALELVAIFGVVSIFGSVIMALLTIKGLI